MARFVILFNWTDQGVRNVGETVNRVAAARQQAERLGAKLQQFLWTVGSYDCVAIFDAPDMETMTAICLQLGKAGNVRTTTLRGFDETEMRALLQKV